MESKHKAGHLAEAHGLDEADMRRQPRIDFSKPLRDPFPWRELGRASLMIAIAVGFVAGGLKLGGVW